MVLDALSVDLRGSMRNSERTQKSHNDTVTMLAFLREFLPDCREIDGPVGLDPNVTVTL